MTLYGKEYFLSKRTRRIMLLVGEYVNPQIFSIAAAECTTGMATLERTLQKMAVSFRVQSPSSQMGKIMPLKNA